MEPLSMVSELKLLGDVSILFKKALENDSKIERNWVSPPSTLPTPRQDKPTSRPSANAAIHGNE